MTKEIIKGLSKKEVEIIAWLEFYKKYFFYSKDISHFFKNKNLLYSGIQKLMAKKRIIKLNQNKYYLIPIRAKNGSWGEHPFIIIDEIFNGENYYINGWASANYWDLTDQIPSAFEVFTPKKQGEKTVLNTKMIFHRIKKIDKSRVVTKKIGEHNFRIMNRRYSKKWLKLRE